MTGSTLGNTAEAAWDEDGATPALGTLTPPVTRSERPPSAPPAHSVPRETRAAYRDLIMPMLGTVR